MQLLLASVILLLMLAAASWGVWMLAGWFLGLASDSQTAIAALVGVVSVPVITYFTSRSLERGRSRENAIREQKTELYDGLIQGFMSMMSAGTQNQTAAGAAFTALFADAAPKLLTYGSRKVILAWNEFRAVGRTGSSDPLTVILAFEELLKAMRSDLGHPTLTVAKGELVKTFITDFDQLRRADTVAHVRPVRKPRAGGQSA